MIFVTKGAGFYAYGNAIKLSYAQGIKSILDSPFLRKEFVKHLASEFIITLELVFSRKYRLPHCI